MESKKTLYVIVIIWLSYFQNWTVSPSAINIRALWSETSTCSQDLPATNSSPRESFNTQSIWARRTNGTGTNRQRRSCPRTWASTTVVKYVARSFSFPFLFLNLTFFFYYSTWTPCAIAIPRIPLFPTTILVEIVFTTLSAKIGPSTLP